MQNSSYHSIKLFNKLNDTIQTLTTSKTTKKKYFKNETRTM